LVQTLQGESLEERVARLNELKRAASSQSLEQYRQILEMSWIYHDSALEGVVYTPEELNTALSGEPSSDAALIPVVDEIRHHLAAIAHIREVAERKRFAINLDTVKGIYAQLAPEEIEGKGTPKYRKEMPLHRLYFHEIAPPDKISYKMRQLLQWANAAETKRSTHAVRLAAKTHHQFLQIYPFPRHSGKVARLLLNLILMHHGYPPVIIHATERQRYYEALKQSENATSAIINEALAASVESAIRFFEEAEGQSA
jgi:Fic family protein